MLENASNKSSLLDEIADIENSLKSDIGAERANAMIEYFDSIRQSSQAELALATSADRREQISKAMQAFEAAQRIIRHIWESLHSTAFPA